MRSRSCAKKCLAPIAATQFRYKVQYAKIEHAFLSWVGKIHTILSIDIELCRNFILAPFGININMKRIPVPFLALYFSTEK